jgi:hypothetical protein
MEMMTNMDIHTPTNTIIATITTANIVSLMPVVVKLLLTGINVEELPIAVAVCISLVVDGVIENRKNGNSLVDRSAIDSVVGRGTEILNKRDQSEYIVKFSTAVCTS